MTKRAEEILAYWFGDADRANPSAEDLEARIALWFESGGRIDAEVDGHFRDDLARAARGEYDTWAENPRDMLALVVVLDQFTRNIHRGSAQAFAYDAKSVALSRDAIARGYEAIYNPVHRVAIYLPLMHAENIEIQRLSLASYRRLYEESPIGLRVQMVKVLRAAERHFEIIERFGRYPHRNEILGRGMSAVEIAFLNEPNSSF